MRIALILLFIFCLNNFTWAEQFKTLVFQENIATLQCHPKGAELGYPILNKGTNTPLLLSFDLIGNEQPPLAYRIIHCDSEWNKSEIPTREFLNETLNEFYIEDYELSTATKILYTHYEVEISPQKLKLSGNYIIQVFSQDNTDDILLQQRFLYAESLTTLSGTAQKELSQRYHRMQRVQFKVHYNKEDFELPQSNFKAVVLQNFRWKTARHLKPLFSSPTELNFNYIDEKGRFNGNYEFPYFDTSLLTESNHTLRSIEKDEKGEIHCYLRPARKATANYFFLKDMNGNLSIRAENIFDIKTESEYIWVHFTLASEKLPYPIFVVGRFNQWTATERNQLYYDDELQLYHIGVLLKQGVYNYTFVGNENGVLANILGNYNETENDYYIFIYYKDLRLRTDRLVGWTRINTRQK